VGLSKGQLATTKQHKSNHALYPHCTRYEKHLAKNIDYLKKQAPFGCRDYDTLDFFRNHGIEAYFSGCLTLLIKNPNIGRRHTENIYLVDVKSEFTQILPLEVQEKAITVTHNMKDTNMYDSLARFTAAYQLMETYASAKLVITQRIHCALPCVAMGTPVIFINSSVMPGGGGTKTKSSSRTVGLTPLFHTVDLYAASMESARGWLKNFSWYNPPPNPNTTLMMRLRATAWNVICQNQALYDAAHKFGLLYHSHLLTHLAVISCYFTWYSPLQTLPILN